MDSDVIDFIYEASLSSEMYPGVVVDKERLGKSISDLSYNPDGFIQCTTKDGKITGVIVGCIQRQSPLYNVDLLATELLWYVKPEDRGAGSQLVKAFEEWALDKGANYITMCHMNNEHADRLGKYYEKLGYTKTETTYMKRVN